MNQLTRRDFLKLCGTSSFGLALAACGITPTPTTAPAPKNTTLPTNTSLPTATATLTNTPIPTNAPTPTLTPTNTSTLTSTPTRLLPELYADGPYIKRRDNGESVQLKGVNVLVFYLEETPTLNSVRKYVDIAMQWGANLIRLQLDIAKFDVIATDNKIVENSVVELEKTIDYFKNQGMYCILSPCYYGKVALTSPRDEIAEIMSFLSSRFKAKSNVLYGLVNELVNEPGEGRNWNKVLPGLTKIATAIRRETPKAVLVIPGLNWNRNFSIFSDSPNAFPFDNLVFDIHYYLTVDDKGNDITEQTYEFRNLIGKKPILFGEAGVPSHLGGLTNLDDKKYVNAVLDMVKQNPKMAHYTGFAMSKGGVAYLINADNSPSPRGLLYFNDMKAFPPTDFSK